MPPIQCIAASGSSAHSDFLVTVRIFPVLSGNTTCLHVKDCLADRFRVFRVYVTPITRMYFTIQAFQNRGVHYSGARQTHSRLCSLTCTYHHECSPATARNPRNKSHGPRSRREKGSYGKGACHRFQRAQVNQKIAHALWYSDK